MSEKIVEASFRDISTITAEIKVLQRQTQRLVLEYAIEVGRRLHEAKELLPHGEWGKWLKEEVSFSQSTANNLMKIFDEYGADQIGILGAEANSQALGNLSYTKALRLLALPAEEREEFVQEHDVESISTRELDRLIKENKELNQALSAAEHRAQEAEAKSGNAALREELEKARLEMEEFKQMAADADQQATENEAKLREQLEAAQKTAEKAKAAAEKAKEAKKKAEDKLKAARENPEVPDEIIDKLRKEAEEKAAAAAQNAERELASANAKLENLEKKLKLADPDTAVFKTYFDAVQEDFNRLCGSLMKIDAHDPDTAAKLRAAVSSLIDCFEDRLFE